MAGKQIDISHLIQIFRLYIQWISIKRICEATQIARNTIRKHIRLNDQSTRSVEDILDMDDEELYSILIGTKLTSNDRSVSLTALFPYYESALRRPGVNLVVLW
jgi:succinate dehydrogenase flavin-adding protein (antitoxin of CptAB toxin-antitoxin module)